MPNVEMSGITFEIKGSSNSASKSIENLTRQLRILNATLARSKSIGTLSTSIKQVGNAAKAASKHTSNFANSIIRIAKYRMIRGAIKAVTSAFQEGLKNAYQFSKINGGELAASMDLLATKSLTMKNQLGAAFGALITAITPIIVQLISLITRLANALSMLFAALGGQSQYKKAVDVWTEWGEAAGGAGAAAKEALKYLAPFDELNRLPDDRGGGGGGGAATPDFSEMFEYQDLPEWLQHFADKMSELASSLKITFNDVFFDWSDLTGEQIAEKAIVGLSALVGGGVGFLIGGVPGAIVGTLLGASIGLLISSMTFDHDGVLSQQELANTLAVALSALCGGVIGFVVGGVPGALIGAAIGIGVSGGLIGANFFADGKLGNVAEQFATALTILTGAVIGFTVGGFPGALLGAALGIGVSAAITEVEFSASGNGSAWQGLNYFVTEVLGMPTDEEWKQYGRNIWNWIVEGFRDFVGELKNIFVQPIIDAFQDFSFKDIFGGDSSSGNSNEGSFSLQAVITDVVDRIPGAKKVIDGVKGIFGSTDNGKGLSSSSKEVDAVAKFVRIKSALTGDHATSLGNPIFDSVAKFIRRENKLTGASATSSGNPIFDSVAKFIRRDNKLTGSLATSSGNPIFQSVAQFVRRENKLTGAYATSSGNPIFDSVAQFVRRTLNFSGNTTDSGNPIFSSTANFISWLTGWKYDPSVDSTANFTDYEDNIWGTPTIDAKANIIDINWNTSTQGIYGYAKGGAYYGGAWHEIPQAASGGSFHGTLFYAGENGAEVVGHAGGRTEVLNRSQLAATMYASVRSAMSGISFNLASPTMGANVTEDGANEDMLYRAFLRALNDSDIDDRPIELDGNVLYHSMVNRNRQNTRLTGVNALA